MTPRLRRILAQLDRIGYYPRIAIDADGMISHNGPAVADGEFYCIEADEPNADVWMNLEMERP